jgi:hypothetical protein
MFQRNLGWIRNRRDLTSSSTRQLLQNNMGLTIYLEGGYVTFCRRRNVFFQTLLLTPAKISDRKYVIELVPMGCLLACFQWLSWKYRLNLLRHVVFIKENLFLIQKLFILRLLDRIGSQIAFLLNLYRNLLQ